ncbi:hypothetical protein ABH924_003338 [Arthrobacter sp. GAS37]|uniref:hypothetical protein n=1 Tax=Arthrobacter sp. GAS37 TaxID=3156261 RepID=UPI003835A1E1
MRFIARSWQGLTANHQRRLVARSLLEIFALLVLFVVVIFPIHVIAQILICAIYGAATFALGAHWSNVASDCCDDVATEERPRPQD